ncbi:MAG: hypothetical protein ACOYJ1_02120 [Peptococcales bacterium]|jgi:hypothetical protein
MNFFYLLPSKEPTKELALFIIGIIIGAVLATLVIGQQVEKVHSENASLIVQLNEKQSQIKALEDTIKEAKKWFIVKEIQINLELPPRNFADKDNLELKISEAVKDMLKNIRGKKVNELDPEVIWHIVDGRQIEILGYTFTLEVRGVMISEKVTFFVYARENE